MPNIPISPLSRVFDGFMESGKTIAVTGEVQTREDPLGPRIELSIPSPARPLFHLPNPFPASPSFRTRALRIHTAQGFSRLSARIAAMVRDAMGALVILYGE